MPYPVDHDTRNRLSAVPMIVSLLQTRGLELAFSPKRVNEREDGVRTAIPGHLSVTHPGSPILTVTG
jgi:hypothetical protein